ncbi:2-amino-4-hydroxy-6-hydroxymethyldihydropteridine diphosphokinase [Sphingomonas cavernae]|uniref:2-amino-4-hydroxy-6-hydroxymethyldihydropteridine pyrophosphokinase n=1 Tax=Sphingomonas cavernae TaxID=2320861 RepID=A0A418WNG6_9SPHN|nr:2-amino-4-hydroxy-6-hydroxymethyldihydropteridine diphosphokinase [Sphingomonas cavernae]RJF91545.1 2-amino-4-hydroxy-6-hydroxymethyldihydropteridine diphosphokinase [Sphingomonas cavernae]
MSVSTYAIALGSNKRHGRYGAPRAVIAAALAEIEAEGVAIRALSATFETAPIGPSRRRYANAAAIVECGDTPPALLARLKRIERAFGRRPAQRWAARVLDLDIVLWSGGIWASPGLGIPHRHFRDRGFVLRPLAEIAPDWRDPLAGLSVRHHLYRLERRTPLTARCSPPRETALVRAVSSVGRATDF